MDAFNFLMQASKKVSSEDQIEKRAYRCTICSDRFPTFKQCKDHYNRVHLRKSFGTVSFNAEIHVEICPRVGKILSQEDESCQFPQTMPTMTHDDQHILAANTDNEFYSRAEKIQLVKEYKEVRFGSKNEWIQQYNEQNNRKLTKQKINHWRRQLNI